MRAPAAAHSPDSDPSPCTLFAALGILPISLHRLADADDVDGKVGLTARLGADLSKLGFRPDDIVQIEVCRYCEKELCALSDLNELAIDKEEYIAKLSKAKSLQKQKTIAKLEARLAKIEQLVTTTQQEIVRLALEPDRTTGQCAFATMSTRTTERVIAAT